MSWRIAHRGGEEGPLVVCWLVGPGLDAALREALPNAEIVATATSDAPLHAAIAAAGEAPDVPLVLVGYSSGVLYGVRSALVAGVHPRAAVTIDGTHASKPPQGWQLDVWREIGDAARAGERMWVATCCVQRYTEALAPGQKGRALATSTVLAQTLDLPDLAALRPSAGRLPVYPGPVVHSVHEGDLHVYAYGSTDCDILAHGAQGNRVLPAMLAQHIAPLYSAGTAGARAVELQGERLGERCVAFCLAEMVAGVGETPPGSNTSPRIREYLAPCYRRETGKDLGLTAAEWCAAAQCYAQRACLRAGEAGAHGYYASGFELEQSAKAVGTFREPGYVPRCGDIAVLRRTGSDPKTAGWQRHIARVIQVDGGRYETIGGNEGNRWQRTWRRLDGQELVGWIAYP